MESNPYKSPQLVEERKAWRLSELFKMTIMELAVVCWVVSILISLDSDAKLDTVDIIAFIISATVTLSAIALTIPTSQWFPFKLRLILLLLILLLMLALILPALQPARESGSRRPKPASTQSEFDQQNNPESEILGSYPIDVDP